MEMSRDKDVATLRMNVGKGNAMSVEFFAIETLRFRVPARSLLPVALRGELCDPSRAFELGLVDQVVPEDQLEARALETATAMAALSPMANAQIKAAIHGPLGRRDLRAPARALARYSEQAQP